LALLVIFMVQNTDDVVVEFLGWSFTWPVWLLTLVGAFVWIGLGVIRRHRRRKQGRADRRD
jgi:uncharacterized integral membrane protein